MSEPTAAQKLMIGDGLPPSIATLTTEERRQSWASRPSAAQPSKEIVMLTETAKSSKADQVASLRVRKAEARARVSASLGRPLTGKAATKPAKTKKAAQKGSPAARKAALSAKAKAAAVRPGSKLEIIVGLLKRKEGCTAADVLKATEWPAVSMPQQARAAGLNLRTEKEGRTTRYWAA